MNFYENKRKIPRSNTSRDSQMNFITILNIILFSDEQIKEFLNCIQKVRMDNDYFEYGDEILRYNFIIERSICFQTKHISYF